MSTSIRDANRFMQNFPHFLHRFSTHIFPLFVIHPLLLLSRRYSFSTIVIFKIFLELPSNKFAKKGIPLIPYIIPLSLHNSLL